MCCCFINVCDSVKVISRREEIHGGDEEETYVTRLRAAKSTLAAFSVQMVDVVRIKSIKVRGCKMYCNIMKVKLRCLVD